MKFRIFTLALAFLLALNATASTIKDASDNDRMVKKAGSKFAKVDREQLKRDLDETMLIIEELARQARLATPEELKDIWASAERDYKLEDGQGDAGKASCEDILEAMRLENELNNLPAGPNFDKITALNDKINAARESARDQMRSHHRKKSESYIRDLRNWLSISEGVLRRSNEKRQREAKAAEEAAEAKAAPASVTKKAK